MTTSNLERITTRYVIEEDRLQINGSTTTGEVQCVWLTQRMLGRLLPVLLQWLQGEGGDALRAELVQGFALQAARAEIEPQAPVPLERADAPWLAQSVDVARTRRAVRVLLRGAQGQQATLTLDPKLLRQWLAIVHGAYRKAQWPMDVWPAWVSESIMPVAPQARPLH